jgi:GNAT superfamily N-acetyltransferase
MPPTVHPAQLADIPSWLELARQVEPLFGAMPMFELTLRSKICQDEALCVRGTSGAVNGGLLLGGAEPEIWIRWLAVQKAARGQGIGTALVASVIARFAAPGTISLATFGADVVEGRPARRLYERMGFAADAMLPRGPEGGTRQLFTLVRT